MPTKEQQQEGSLSEGAIELTKESQTSIHENGKIVKVLRGKSDISIFHINTLSKLNEFIASAFVIIP